MSRRCQITGKQPASGNNVSHAHNKTRRRFLPNIQETSMMSDALGRMIRIKVSTAALRTIEKAGGLDAFLASRAVTKLDPSLRRLKRQVEKKTAATA